MLTDTDMKINKLTKIAAFAAAFILAAASFASCGTGEKEPTSPAVPEETTENVPSLAEMCPPTYKRDIPVKIETDIKNVDVDALTEIDADNAMIEGLSTDKICRDADKREYYFLTDGTVVMSFLENGDAYSAFYRDTGIIKYFGDSETSWYFTENGTVDMVSFTFVNAKGSDIINYYETDGTRIAVSAAGTYYDDNMDELSAEKQLEFTKRLGSTAAETDTETTADAETTAGA